MCYEISLFSTDTDTFGYNYTMTVDHSMLCGAMEEFKQTLTRIIKLFNNYKFLNCFRIIEKTVDGQRNILVEKNDVSCEQALKTVVEVCVAHKCACGK